MGNKYKDLAEQALKLFKQRRDDLDYSLNTLDVLAEINATNVLKLESKLDTALVALKSVARNDVNWSHAIVEKALKEIEES